jgi:transposase-like protein
MYVHGLGDEQERLAEEQDIQDSWMKAYSHKCLICDEEMTIDNYGIEDVKGGIHIEWLCEDCGYSTEKYYR